MEDGKESSRRLISCSAPSLWIRKKNVSLFLRLSKTIQKMVLPRFRIEQRQWQSGVVVGISIKVEMRAAARSSS